MHPDLEDMRGVIFEAILDSRALDSLIGDGEEGAACAFVTETLGIEGDVRWEVHRDRKARDGPGRTAHGSLGLGLVVRSPLAARRRARDTATRLLPKNRERQAQENQQEEESPESTHTPALCHPALIASSSDSSAHALRPATASC